MSWHLDIFLTNMSSWCILNATWLPQLFISINIFLPSLFNYKLHDYSIPNFSNNHHNTLPLHIDNSCNRHFQHCNQYFHIHKSNKSTIRTIFQQFPLQSNFHIISNLHHNITHSYPSIKWCVCICLFWVILQFAQFHFINLM